jgi:hypothetical protein
LRREKRKRGGEKGSCKNGHLHVEKDPKEKEVIPKQHVPIDFYYQDEGVMYVNAILNILWSLYLA